MASREKNKHKPQTWLHISSNSLTVFETGLSRDKLPSLSVKAILRANNPVENASTHAEWVKKHSKGTLHILLEHELYELLLSDVPDVPDEELEGAIELKAADLISYDLEEATLDIIQLPNEAYRGRMRMAFIVACRKTPIQNWLTELMKFGIKVDVIDVDITQLRNLALFHQNFNESGILHLQNNQSRLLLNYQDEMVLSRSFDTGLSSLITETTVDDGELEITVSEDSDQSTIQIESLVLEIRRTFDYYESQLGLGAIAEIQFLCDSQHEQLAAKIAQKLGVRFVLNRPEDAMHIQLPEGELDPVSFYSLCGTVYREALS